MEITQTGIEEVDRIMEQSYAAFHLFRKTSPEARARFLDTIADEIESLGDDLIQQASAETHLPYNRLAGERNRTTGQLRSFAAMLREGSWVDAAIDTALPDREPMPKPDIRRMMIALGPVVVFGASNFPFAYSTAGGDTAAALAAGCAVVVKAHQAHGRTSELVSLAIARAILKAEMPTHCFQHLHGEGNEIGKALVQHPLTSAVGFTGSHSGGRALFDYAAARKQLIPVFSEMGSTNPVIFLPDTIRRNNLALSEQYAASITQSVGQFCTNPGILLAIDSPELESFAKFLSEKIAAIEPARMLYEKIGKTYTENRAKILADPAVTVLNDPPALETEVEGIPTLAIFSADDFLQNEALREEVFGPFSILVKCMDIDQLIAVWKTLSGQLTTSIMGTETDLSNYPQLAEIAESIAGRIIFNGVPTGVEVCPSMVHGGPYPATTDSRFTAVGWPSVKRWLRPVAYQNAPAHCLPPELQDENPRAIWRLVNNTWTKDPVN